MIIDTIDNLQQYTPLNPLIAEVVKFLKQNDLASLPVGKHPILGERLFVNVQAKEGKKRDEAVIEYHKKMIDIQIPISDSETFGYTPVCDLPDAPFDEAKDIAKLPGVKPQTYVTLKAGQIAIFFPQDGHAPCISEAHSLKKAIFKLDVKG
ncbi:MAG: YhcH/YjgK/YiaL family protein [Prevotella sp.]|jgi:YhcH/YjgK/YiaL family protein